MSLDTHRVRTLGVMGTELVIEAIGPDPEALDKALAAAIVELERIEDAMTSWRDSELTRLNARAGTGPVAATEELCRLVARGLVVAELSDGAFDPTFAGVGKLWDFKADPPLVPDEAAITEALGLVGWQRVRVDLVQHTIALDPGQRLGLGGIAKGYGVDRAMAVLIEHGVEHAMVNAGGDLKALGLKFGKPWRIALRHPRREQEVIAVLPVANTCVVTSGDYERFFELDGVRYHHILDPRTGQPATGCISATVVAPDAAAADALATALCVMGPEQGLAMIEALGDIEALVVDLSGKVHRSSGLKVDSAVRSEPEPGSGG